MAANCSLSLTGMAKRTKEINKLVATTLCLSVTRVLREKSSNKLSADYSTKRKPQVFATSEAANWFVQCSSHFFPCSLVQGNVFS